MPPHGDAVTTPTRKGRALREEEQTRVRAAVNKLLDTHTQEALADIIGFSQSTISSAINRRSGSSIFFAMAVARAANIPPSDLIDFPSVDVPEMGVRAFFDWIYETPGLSEVVSQHRDVTIQDLFRLRATPARGGETDAVAIYQHILQLREGAPVPHEVIAPEEITKLLPPAQSVRKKRNRTP